MSLKLAELELGWPERQVLLSPQGSGAKATLELVTRRLSPQLHDHWTGEVNFGVITRDPTGDASDPPIGIITEFDVTPPEEVVAVARRAAWNFSYAPLLVTAEPKRLSAWSCWEAPPSPMVQREPLGPIAHIDPAIGDSRTQRSSRELLDWSSIISRNFLQTIASRFQRSSRVERSLIENLRVVSRKLRAEGLGTTESLGILTSIISLSYLEQKHDRLRQPFLTSELLARFSPPRGATSRLADIVGDGASCAVLLRFVQESLGGDLVSDEAIKCYSHISPRIGQLLSELVSGNLYLRGNQLTLWPLYQFDTIPVELVANLYQASGNNVSLGIDSVTPPHVASFMVETALTQPGVPFPPTILDPCCGSGTLLVKAFQRLTLSWREDHDWSYPDPNTLKMLLSRLQGIDTDENALHATRFSLHLAFLEELLQSYTWKDVQLGTLHGRQLTKADFFDYCHSERADSADVIIGSVPWGRRALRDLEPANRWSKRSGWRLVNKGVDMSFLSAALENCRPGGSVTMLLPADSFLFKRSSSHLRFRERLFSQRRISEITIFDSRGYHDNGKSETVVVVAGSASPVDTDCDEIQFLVARDAESDEMILIDAHYNGPRKLDTVFR